MRDRRNQNGFSLLETMASMTILLVISGSVFSAMQYYQKSSGSTQLKIDMHSGLRGAIELMTQEIGQAGLLNFTSRTVTSGAITGSSTAQTVTLNSASYIFVGEKLLVGAGSSQEEVTVTAVNSGSNTITGVFTQNQATSAPVNAVGIFPAGIVASSSATQLQLFGDINGDGTLYYVRYDCDATAGTLSRSSTPIGAGSANAPQVLVSGVIANPGSTDCFQYTTVTSGAYTFKMNVAITISVRTATIDPQTRQYVTMTKSFLNLSPRNILAARDLLTAGMTSRLQPTPPGVPLT